MYNFPTLSAGVTPAYPLSEQRIDVVLRSETEGGYVQTRAGNTRIRKLFGVFYSHLSIADKVAIDNFVTTVNGGADSFTWTHPESGTSYTVRFNPVPTFTYVSYGRYNASFSVEQL